MPTSAFSSLPTISGPLSYLSVEEFVADIGTYLAAPAAYRLADGTPVLSAFAAELRTPQWWAVVLEALTAKLHTKIAFVPIFVDASNKIAARYSISYGFSAWGGRNPRGMSLSDHSRLAGGSDQPSTFSWKDLDAVRSVSGQQATQRYLRRIVERDDQSNGVAAGDRAGRPNGFS